MYSVHTVTVVSVWYACVFAGLVPFYFMGYMWAFLLKMPTYSSKFCKLHASLTS